MVVGDLDVCRTGRCPGEADAPLVVDSDAVLPLPVAMQLLEAVARRYSKVVDVFGGVEDQELAVGNSLKVGAELADVRAIPDELGFLVRERLDRSQSITRCVTIANKSSSQYLSTPELVMDIRREIGRASECHSRWGTMWEAMAHGPDISRGSGAWCRCLDDRGDRRGAVGWVCAGFKPDRVTDDVAHVFGPRQSAWAVAESGGSTIK